MCLSAPIGLPTHYTVAVVLDHQTSRKSSWKETSVFPFSLFIWFSSLCFSLSFFMIIGTVLMQFHYPSKRVHGTFSTNIHKNRPVSIYAWCQLVDLDKYTKAHTNTHIQVTQASRKVFQQLLPRLHKKNTHGTATGHIELPLSSKRCYSDNLSTHLIPHEQWALRILKMDSNLSSANRSSWQLCTPTALWKCTGSVTLHYTHQTLTPSYADDIAVFNHIERH